MPGVICRRRHTWNNGNRPSIDLIATWTKTQIHTHTSVRYTIRQWYHTHTNNDYYELSLSSIDQWKTELLLWQIRPRWIKHSKGDFSSLNTINKQPASSLLRRYTHSSHQTALLCSAFLAFSFPLICWLETEGVCIVALLNREMKDNRGEQEWDPQRTSRPGTLRTLRRGSSGPLHRPDTSVGRSQRRSWSSFVRADAWFFLSDQLMLEFSHRAHVKQHWSLNHTVLRAATTSLSLLFILMLNRAADNCPIFTTGRLLLMLL